MVQKIIAQSIKLQQLGVDVHLHWVPGHRDIPRNELADLVAKRFISQSNKALKDLCSSHCFLCPARQYANFSRGVNRVIGNSVRPCEVSDC